MKAIFCRSFHHSLDGKTGSSAFGEESAAIARSLRSADDQRGGWRLLMITARTSSGIVFVEQTNCGAIFTAAPQGELSRPLDDPNVSDSRIDGQFIERSRDHANHLERQAMKCLRTMAA
jgi:hypothetical protein